MRLGPVGTVAGVGDERHGELEGRDERTINPRERGITDRAPQYLVDGFHGGASGQGVPHQLSSRRQ